jgi:D-aminoacyl-tRNA deacylase
LPIVVTSDLDLASVNIRKQLITLFGFKQRTDGSDFDSNPVYASGETLLISSKRDLVASEHIEKAFRTDLFIFASRHRSEARKPGLLVHCTGNWTGEAQLGGRPYELAVAPASAMKDALRELSRQKSELGLGNYEVTMECTHHGPTSLSIPLMFVEVGSDEEHWCDELAARAVASTVCKVAKGVNRFKSTLGIGGPHYSPNFTKIVLSSPEIAVGHIIPNYVLQGLKKEMVQKAIERTLEKVELIVLDWKGLRAEHREFIKHVMSELGIESVKTHEIAKEE